MLHLDPDNSVVVVIDWQERLVGVMPEALRDEALARAVLLVRGARAAGVPVLASEQYPEGLGPTVQPLRDAWGDEVAPVAKREFSCAEVPEFVERLEALGRSHVVLVGMESHICVYQTARGLAEQGRVVHVPLDAVLSRKTPDFRAAVSLYRQIGVVTTSVEVVLFDWVRRGEGAVFKEISRLVR